MIIYLNTLITSITNIRVKKYSISKVFFLLESDLAKLKYLSQKYL